MRKLALSDEILMTIEKPARYIGGEVNAVMKDKEKVDIRFAMCFPDVYEIGMSHLGIQILYDMISWVLPFSMRCATPISCRCWIWHRSRWRHPNVQRSIPLSLAAVPVPIIRNRWQISLICSISERVKWFMEPFLTLTRQTRRPVAADRISF